MTARLAWVPVGGLALAAALSLAVNGLPVFDPPWLLVPLNLVFLTVLPLGTAVVAIRAYERTGVAAVLALGAGSLAVSLGAGIVPALLLFSAGSNATVTIHNTSVLLAGACQLVAALGGVLGVTLGPGRRRHAAIAYGTVVVLVALVVTASLAGLTPPFWTGDGPTQLRQTVLRLAIVLFGIASFAWWEVSVRDREIRFLHWYVPGLVLMAVGLVGVLQQPSIGDALSWLGRIGQFLSGVYLLVAVLPESRPRSGTADDNRARATLGMTLLQASLPLQPLVQSAADAVVAVNRAGRIVYWNATAEERFGRSSADAFDAQPADLLVPLDATPDERERIHALLSPGSPAIGAGPQELELADGRGSHVAIELAAYAGSRYPHLMVFVLRDVSERLRARDELERRVRERTADLERANEELERASRAKDEFLSLVSHELRTPMTTILAAGSLLARRPREQDPDGLADDVLAEGLRLAGIVDNLLALARLDTGRMEDPEPIALDRLLRRAVMTAERTHPGRQIDLSVQGVTVVEGGESQLEMVMANYLANALKYSPPDAPVEVRLECTDDLARVSVLDRGPGIDPIEAEELFEPFRRGARTSATPGIGIGLTVCQRLVESMGGAVAAAPRADGQGAEFSFTLPLVHDQPDDGDR